MPIAIFGKMNFIAIEINGIRNAVIKLCIHVSISFDIIVLHLDHVAVFQIVPNIFQ